MIAIHDLPQPEELNDEQAAAVFGGRTTAPKKLQVSYNVTKNKLLQNKARVVKRILARKTVQRVTKLKNGVYTVRYKATIHRQKKTESKSNYSPARSFNIR